MSKTEFKKYLKVYREEKDKDRERIFTVVELLQDMVDEFEENYGAHVMLQIESSMTHKENVRDKAFIDGERVQF